MGKNLIIIGADFSANGLLHQVFLKNGLSIAVANNNPAALRAATGQATVVMTKTGLENNKWSVDSVADFPNKQNYALNTIPTGAKKITASDTTKQKNISICLYDENYVRLFNPSWSAAGTYTQEINIANYPGAVYYSLNYQNSPTDMDTLSIVFTY